MRGGGRTLITTGRILAGLALAGPVGAPAWAGDRSVTIIEGTSEPQEPAVAPPADGAILPTLRTDNAAGLTLRVVPGDHLHLGTQITLAISTQQPGYLVLVDINGEGRWTQIYPNVYSLSRTAGDVATANLMRPGPPITVPNLKNPLARFTFTADPPKGDGAVVAILSNRPVQIIDLPESPATPLSLQAAVETIARAVTNLQIASANGAAATGGHNTWSFVAVPYRIE